MNSNQSRPVPPANTGSKLLDFISDTALAFMHFERRFDPFFRPAFDAVLRDPLARFVTALINAQRVDEKLALAEERPLPGEEEFVDSIIASFQAQMRGLWKPGGFERGGNTKTHGIVRAEFIVHDGLPAAAAARHLRRAARPIRAWVRFSGPGPYITPDIDDVGFMSISIKLMGVPGPKLMDEEKFTQDMFGVSPPTFVTPDVKRQRAAADREPEERLDLLLRQPAPAAHPRLHHAGPVHQDPEQPVRGALLQLRAVPARRRPGDAVLGLAEDEEADADPAPAVAAARRLPAPGDGRRARRRRRRARLSHPAPDRSAPDADRERRACSGPSGCRRASRWRRCAFRARSSTRRRRSSSPSASRTTRGTASPSIARSATRAARGAACTWRCRRCATR